MGPGDQTQLSYLLDIPLASVNSALKLVSMRHYTVSTALNSGLVLKLKQAKPNPNTLHLFGYNVPVCSCLRMAHSGVRAEED